MGFIAPASTNAPVPFSLPQGRKANKVRDKGLSALPSSALIGVERRFAFFTSFPFIPRFYLDFIAPGLRWGTPFALCCVTDGRMKANTKRRYYTKQRGNLPCPLRPIPASTVQAHGKMKN